MRRDWIEGQVGRSLRSITLSLLAATVATSTVAGQDEAPAPLRMLDFDAFESAIEALADDRRTALDTIVLEATIDELQAAMEIGELSSVELTTYYLSRIHELDVGGLQSMNELNPDALAIAAALDEERRTGGVRGPLHGIPVSLKDNIGTGDALHTTAGAAALSEARADRDSTVAARLREAGAVLLGKANLTEWANFMNQPGRAGFSALGGQVANAYGANLTPSGSSAGSAVGTSANLVAASIGTETAGSIVAPAAANGVVGLKPSLGLVSRDRIIPITDQIDSPGTLARTVADAATLLSVIAGEDPADPFTTDAAEAVGAAGLAEADFTSFLDHHALQGKRVGYYTGGPTPPEGMTEADYIELVGMTEAIAGLEAAGAEVSLVWAELLSNDEDFLSLGLVGLRDGVAAYLAATDPDGPIGSITDVVDFNAADLGRYAPFGQNMLEAAAGLPEVSREEYDAAGSELREKAREHVDALFAEHELDVLITSGNRLSGAYAVAGYPAITVPAGFGSDGNPRGLTFTGRYLEDGAIIGYAYAFEQAAGLRQPPPSVARD